MSPDASRDPTNDLALDAEQLRAKYDGLAEDLSLIHISTSSQGGKSSSRNSKLCSQNWQVSLDRLPSSNCCDLATANSNDAPSLFPF